MKRIALTLLPALLLAIQAPASAHGRHGHGHHGHHGHGYKETYWDGHCKVERKYKHGGYKEKRKCRAPSYAYYDDGYRYREPVYYVEPRPVYVEPRPVYVQPRPVYVEPGVSIHGTFHFR
ncbi:hypothetical protein B0920_18200 [Massilia sp. KIM]|uniref:hypothetical protein n=1 Tax=Massilia sp. KIM TaxID=1955422 RepID=UPI00098EAD48|nr:hypothetical protein [Massilia sp. KIM]OON60877.1 hypothetical protein B0920_18200 [Massilia sp. KIM]